MPPKRLAEISKTTNIKYKTLETWRRKLKCDPNYIPIHGKKGNPKKLSVKQENVIFKKLVEMYLDNSRYCPPRINKSLAKQVIPDYSFSDGLLLGFMECFNLSSRVPHMKRRTNPNDEQVSHFLENMELVNLQFPHDLIFNIDETCWRITNGKLKTIAPKGSDQVNITLKEDPKKCLTVIACCSKSGDRLPLWLIAKGKTTLCEQKFRKDLRLCSLIRSKKLFVDHSENGWSNDELIIQYLNWLKEFKRGMMLNVLWDVYIHPTGQKM